MSVNFPHLGSTGDGYVLGVNADELARLGLQHRLWSDAAHALWRDAGLRPGHRVLDLGAGPGFAAADLLQIVAAASPGHPLGTVIAVDESRSYLEHAAAYARARTGIVPEILHADLNQPGSLSPLAGKNLDAAYARWVFCFVKDPQAVIFGVRDALKPGGRLIVQDYFDYESMTVAPRRESFTKAVAATGKSWRLRGGDPDIIGRLPGILEASGFRVTLLRAHQRIARPHEQMWHWPHTFWHNFLPVLVGLGLLTEADHRQWLRDWDELSTTPGAFAKLPPVFDLIAEMA